MGGGGVKGLVGCGLLASQHVSALVWGAGFGVGSACLRHFNLPACGSRKFWFFKVLDWLRLILLVSRGTFEVVHMLSRLGKDAFIDT